MPFQMSDIVLHDIFPALCHRHSFIIRCNGVSYYFADRTVLRDIAESDVDQFPYILFIKGNAFHCCNKYLGINPFPVSVVNNGIFKGILCSKLRTARIEACPDICPDVRTAAVLKGIVKASADRRL